MTIDFGVIDHIDKQAVPIYKTYDSRLKLLELYDKAGFNTFHLTEHHFTPLGLAPSPLVFLAAASRITERIRLAPLVLILTLYNPLRVAAEICMVDHLTKGRLDIGTGRGISPYELAYYGVNHLEAPAIYREAVQVLTEALTKDVVNHQGTYFKFFNVPIELRPFQQPHPPLWVATGSTDTAAWAARQNMNICFLQPSSRARILVESYKKSWNSTHGGTDKKMPKIGITRHIYVGETDQEAIERGLFGLRGWLEKWAYLWQKFDPRPASSQEDTHTKARTIIMGSPATVRAEIEQQLQETGANYFVARFAYGELSHEESVRSLELFTKEIMPHFQRAER